MQNPDISWSKVQKLLDDCTSAEEVRQLWNFMDSRCYGREDIELLDDMTNKKLESLNTVGEKQRNDE